MILEAFGDRSAHAHKDIALFLLGRILAALRVLFRLGLFFCLRAFFRLGGLFFRGLRLLGRTFFDLVSHCQSSVLLGFPVERVLFAESAILVHLQPIGRVFLVLLGVVVALFALRARKGDLDSHFGTSVTQRQSRFFIACLRKQGTKKEPSFRGKSTIPYRKRFVKCFFVYRGFARALPCIALYYLLYMTIRLLSMRTDFWAFLDFRIDKPKRMLYNTRAFEVTHL